VGGINWRAHLPLSASVGASVTERKWTRGLNMFDENFVQALSTEIAQQVKKELRRETGLKRLMTLPETATYLGRSVGAIEQLIKRGTLPVTKIDGKRQIDRLVLDRIIDDNTHWAA
jgi:hypothetical protein